MNAFDSARGVEAKAMALLMPYLEEVSDGRLVLTSKGSLSRWLQESVGDVILMRADTMYGVEIKAERKDTRNVFLETWSNRNLEERQSHADRGQSPGWTMKIRADLLLYYFIDTDRLLSFDVLELKRWLFGKGEDKGIWGTGRFAERLQRRYTQMNDTWGLVVPQLVLWNELPRGAMRGTSVRQLEIKEVAA